MPETDKKGTFDLSATEVIELRVKIRGALSEIGSAMERLHGRHLAEAKLVGAIADLREALRITGEDA